MPVKTGSQYSGLASRALSEVYAAPGTTTKKAISSTSASQALTAGSLYYTIADVDCWLKVGGTSTTSEMFLPAKVPMFFRFAGVGSSAPTVHIITATGTSGNIYFTAMSEADGDL